MARNVRKQGPPPDLIYGPASRGNIGLLLMIAGPSGSGKTKSALRLAAGLAGPGGQIDVCDTEHGRALYYAPLAGQAASPPDDFAFNHYRLTEPFTPARFEEAAVVSQQRKSAVWVCDSFSHEHVGPGGMLDMFADNLDAMVAASMQRNPAGGPEWERREQLKFTAWIEPKGQHKHLLQRLWQLNTHIILCCHADPKLKLVRNARGKTAPSDDKTPVPICAPDIPYAMTASFLLSAERPGVPMWLKRFDKIEPLISSNHPLDEATGARLAAWARGEKPQPVSGAATPQARRAPPPQDGPPPDDGRFPGDDPPDGPPPGHPAAEARSTPPPDSDGKPGLPENEDSLPESLSGSSQGQPAEAGKTQAAFAELLAAFKAVKVRKDHTDIVDEKVNRDRLTWLKRNRPEMHAQIDVEMKAAWARTAPQPQEKPQ